MIVFITLLVLLSALFAEWVRRRKAHFNKLAECNIPGPKAHWFFGNAFEVAYYPNDPSKQNSMYVKDAWLKKYGKVVGFHNGYASRVMITDLDMLKQVLIKDSNIFINRTGMDPTMKMLVTTRDQEWKDLRRLLTPIFSSAKLKKMTPLMESCMDPLMEVLDKEANKQGNEFDIYEILKCVTMDVIDKCAMDLKLDCVKNPESYILEQTQKFLTTPIPMWFIVTFAMPQLKTILRMAMRKGFAGYGSFLKNCLEQIGANVEERKKKQSIQTRVDAMQLMLEANSEDGHAKTKLTNEEVVANSFMFLLAGFETTSNALAYTMHLLSKHQEFQEVIYQEVSDIMGDKLVPDYEDIQKMEYTEAFIMESLRMYPPITHFINREVSADWSYGKYKLMKGMNIEVPIWSIHHDPEIYHDPETFMPERFLGDEKTSRHPLAWLPFGAGPRNCIGLRFAMIEAKLAVATLVKRYEIKACQKTVDPLTLRTVHYITNPASGIWVNLEQRQKEQ